MKRVLVHSTKYDGSIHYRYHATVVHEDADLLQLYRAPGTRATSYRGDMLGTRHSLEIFWPDRLYNVHVIWYPDWRPSMHYVNIATPATWGDGTLRFIDLDLDVIWRAQTGEIVLDDEDEFVLHQARFGYPPELIAQVWHASQEVQDMMARRVYPFDGSLLAWRPHGSA
jgi:protein associated with RNAse G/E